MAGVVVASRRRFVVGLGVSLALVASVLVFAPDSASSDTGPVLGVTARGVLGWCRLGDCCEYVGGC